MPSLNVENGVDIQQVQLSQFFSSDNTQVVQVGKDVLVNNMIAPYKGWNVFKEQILRVVGIYSSNFIEKPKIRRITLKYLNVFNFDIQKNYYDIFSFELPNPPLAKYKNNRAFNTVVEYDLDGGDVLGLTFRSLYPPDKSKKSVSLEITNQQSVPKITELENFERWLTLAHKNIEDLFVASLKKPFLHSLK